MPNKPADATTAALLNSFLALPPMLKKGFLTLSSVVPPLFWFSTWILWTKPDPHYGPWFIWPLFLTLVTWSVLFIPYWFFLLYRRRNWIELAVLIVCNATLGIYWVWVTQSRDTNEFGMYMATLIFASTMLVMSVLIMASFYLVRKIRGDEGSNINH